MILRDLLDAWPLAPIAAGVALLLLFGRDPKAADEHTVDDYQPEPSSGCETVPCPTEAVGQVRLRLRPDALIVLAPSATVTPLGAPELVGPLDALAVSEPPSIWAELTAARFLREIAAVEQAKAGIRPAYATDRRDMTGAFPVVRAAA